MGSEGRRWSGRGCGGGGGGRRGWVWRAMPAVSEEAGAAGRREVGGLSGREARGHARRAQVECGGASWVSFQRVGTCRCPLALGEGEGREIPCAACCHSGGEFYLLLASTSTSIEAMHPTYSCSVVTHDGLHARRQRGLATSCATVHASNPKPLLVLRHGLHTCTGVCMSVRR